MGAVMLHFKRSFRAPTSAMVALTVGFSLARAPVALAQAEQNPIEQPVGNGSTPGQGVLASPESAPAGSAEDLRLRAHLEFEAGSYVEAAALFEWSHRLTASARDRFNQGTALHWGGRCEEAREAFEAYLQLQDDVPQERNERQADARSALDHLGTVCPVSRRDPAPALPVLRSPAPSVVARPHESSVSRELPPDTVGARDTLAWSAFGAGAAVAVAAVITGFSSHSAAARIDELGEQAATRGLVWDECCRERVNELDEIRRGYQTATRLLGVGSALLLGTATVLWVVDLDVDDGSSGSTLGGATLGYRSSF
jgi:hypothetical protein